MAYIHTYIRGGVFHLIGGERNISASAFFFINLCVEFLKSAKMVKNVEDFVLTDGRVKVCYC